MNPFFQFVYVLVSSERFCIDILQCYLIASWEPASEWYLAIQVYPDNLENGISSQI